MLGQRFNNPVADVRVAGTPEQIARGAYLVSAFPGCASCHSSNRSATPVILDGNGPLPELVALGNFYAANLTPGGRIKDWSDGEIIRAIREGMDRDGRPLVVMPSEEYRHLSDQDAQAIVAYLRSQPAVSKSLPPQQPNFLAMMLLGAGQIPLSNQAPVGSVTAPGRGPTREWGEHLVDISGCRSCHGPALDAQNIPQGPPPGPSLRSVKGWSEADFLRTMKTGLTPTGRQLNPEFMPWPQFARGSDDDLRALHAYLISLP
jgi:mono/diheme cytochrome c family protein